MGISQWLTSCLDLVGFDRVLPDSWRSRKGRVDGEGSDVWRGGGRERVGQINNGILSGLSSLPLSFSPCFCLCVLSRAPAAFPSWFHSKALDMSQTGQLHEYVCLYLCVYLSMHAIHGQKASYKPGSHTHSLNLSNFSSMPCLPLFPFSSFYLSVFSLLFHQLAFLIFPFYIQPQTTGICVVWCTVVKMLISISPLRVKNKHTSTHMVHAQAIPLPSVLSKPIDSPPALLCGVLLPPTSPPCSFLC